MTHFAFSCRLACVSKRNLAIIKEQLKPIIELRREGRLARITKALACEATVTDISKAEGIGRTPYVM